MNEVPQPLDVAPAEAPCQEWYQSEAESALAFDERIAASGLFEKSFREVRGFYLAHRPGREQKDARIDRILIPGQRLRDAGWSATVGVELKRSGCDFGPAVSQAIDYTYCNWNVGHYWMMCERIFLWPFNMPQGPLASVMLQNGVGTVHGEKYRLYPAFNKPLIFRLERNVITVGLDSLEVAPTTSGRRKGSR